MNWLIRIVKSSLGLKLMMAITGLCFCVFLVVHTAGNLTLYGGMKMFNGYSAHLHALGVIVTVIEWILLLLALIHIITGLTLFFQNLRARPVRYKVNHRAGGRTIGSATMPYTGPLILVFIIIHLLNFHFADKTNTTLFNIVAGVFSSPGYVVFYILGVLLVAVHVSHGFWSAFQTLGANHLKYVRAVRGSSILYALAIGVGLGLLPIFIYFSV